jgi:hypothetical protein
MDDDNSNAYIRKTISLAACEIEYRLNKGTPAAQRLRSLFTDLGFDMTSIRAQPRNLIKLLVRALIEDCKGAIDEDRERVSKFTKSLAMSAVADLADPVILPMIFCHWHLIENALFPSIEFTR